MQVPSTGELTEVQGFGLVFCFLDFGVFSFNILIQESNKLKNRLFFNAKHVCWLLGASRDKVIEDKSKSQDNEKSKVS